MSPSVRLREALTARYGEVNLFLANFPSSPQAKLGKTFAPLLAVMQSEIECLPVRRAASRAAVDLSTRYPGLRIEEVPVGEMLRDRRFDAELRLNCGLVLLNRPKCDRDRVLDEIEGLKQASDQWTAAVARVLLRSRKAERSPEQELVAVATDGPEEEIAAALFLLQRHGISEEAFAVAASRTQHSNPRIRIAAARLSLIQSVLRVAALGEHLANIFRPLSSDGDAQVRAVVPSLLALFVSDSPTVHDITRSLAADSDPFVTQAMQQRWLYGRFCEFFDSPLLSETS